MAAPLHCMYARESGITRALRLPRTPQRDSETVSSSSGEKDAASDAVHDFRSLVVRHVPFIDEVDSSTVKVHSTTGAFAPVGALSVPACPNGEPHPQGVSRDVAVSVIFACIQFLIRRFGF